MIPLNKEIAFIGWYVTEKEYKLTKNVRYALNLIYYFNVIKKKDLALAIDIVNKTMKKNHGIDLEKEFLWKMYRKRKAYIRNAKAAFKAYDMETRRMRGANLDPLPVCECGCGTILKPGRRFVNGHNSRCRSEKKNQELAENMRAVKNAKKKGKIIEMF